VWRVYYEDGTTWDWKQGFEGIPAWGVLCILQRVDFSADNPGYHIVFGCKFYMYAEDEWLHAYDNDVIDYLVHNKHIAKLLVGRMTTKKKFAEIYQAAKNDKDRENL
jgi:hypothetical protein